MRAVTRKPVCPFIVWFGRTESPSRCQVLSKLSSARGSDQMSRSRSVSTILESWVVVATYTTSDPPGRSARSTVSRHSHGASMSKTTASKTSSCVSHRAKSSTLMRQLSGYPPNHRHIFSVAISAKLGYVSPRCELVPEVRQPATGNRSEHRIQHLLLRPASLRPSLLIRLSVPHPSDIRQQRLVA